MIEAGLFIDAVLNIVPIQLYITYQKNIKSSHVSHSEQATSFLNAHISSSTIYLICPIIIISKVF